MYGTDQMRNAAKLNVGNGTIESKNKRNQMASSENFVCVCLLNLHFNWFQTRNNRVEMEIFGAAMCVCLSVLYTTAEKTHPNANGKRRQGEYSRKR